MVKVWIWVASIAALCWLTYLGTASSWEKKYDRREAQYLAASVAAEQENQRIQDEWTKKADAIDKSYNANIKKLRIANVRLSDAVSRMCDQQPSDSSEVSTGKDTSSFAGDPACVGVDRIMLAELQLYANSCYDWVSGFYVK